MSDLKTFQIVFGAVLLVMLWCVLTWLATPWPDRLARLQSIARQEQLQGLPPETLLAQAPWLVRARLARLWHLSVVLGIAAVIGLAEGWGRRRTDVLGGFRFSLWTVGAVLLCGFVGGLALSLVLPWAVPLTGWIPLMLAGYVGLLGFALAAGLPHLS